MYINGSKTYGVSNVCICFCSRDYSIIVAYIWKITGECPVAVQQMY